VIRDVYDKFEHLYPVAAKFVRAWCYMDDAIASTTSEKGLEELAEQLPPLLMHTDMKMAKFYSNSYETLKAIPEEL